MVGRVELALALQQRDLLLFLLLLLDRFQRVRAVEA